MMIKPLLRYFTMITVSLLFSACTYVSPWEKGTLARQEMMLAPDPLEERLRDHVFYAKEASSSGSAVSGGGCGCN